MKIKKVITVESDAPVVILSHEEYEALQETIAWLSVSPHLWDEVQDELQKIKEGKGVTLKKLREELEQ